MNLYRSRTTALLPLTRSGAANRRPDAEHPDEIKPHAMSGSLRLWVSAVYLGISVILKTGFWVTIKPMQPIVEKQW